MKIKSVTKAVALTAAFVCSFALTSQAKLALEYGVESAQEKGFTNQAETAQTGFFGESAFELPESLTEATFPETERPTSFTEQIKDGDGIASLLSVFFNGDGTQESPYLLSNAADLRRFSIVINADTSGEYQNSYFVLTDDINYGGAEWTPVGSYASDTGYNTTFQGHFDGQGHTISNFVITKEYRYIGFFGLVYNGSVKNLTISDVKISVNYDSLLYAGSLAGRYLGLGSNKKAAIENCHAENVTLTVESGRYSVYAGGLIGYLHASKGASLTLSDSSADVDLSGTVSGYPGSASASDRFNVTLGGLVGYVGAIEDNSAITIKNSYSLSHVNAVSTVNRTRNDNIKAGGLLGYFGSDQNTAITLSGCYSSGGVISSAIADNFSGGLLGYLIASESDLTVENCYTTSNVYARSSRFSSYIGGFTSVAGVLNSDGFILENCYAAGNVIDSGSNSSEGGKFTADAQGDMSTFGLYTHEDSLLICDTTFVPAKTLDKQLTSQDALNLSRYTGFDSSVWKSRSAPYPYPVLANTPYKPGDISLYYMSENGVFQVITGKTYGDKASEPEGTPESNYLFSHWSLYPGGNAAIPEDTHLISDTLFFANFTEDYHIFEISFSADGNIIKTIELPYGAHISFPTAPEKPADQTFHYIFSHWSDTEDGEDNCEDAFVTGNTVFYAVYEKIENSVWDGATATAFSDGTGTADDPYQVKSPANLFYLSQNVASENYRDAYYVLTRDIDLGGHEWTPIGSEESPFCGHFDGAGYAIENFKITNTEKYAGIFGLTQNAIITKLGVSNFNISITDSNSASAIYAGAIAGRMTVKGANVLSEISECYSTGVLEINAAIAYVGGLVGEAAATDDTMLIYIENCYSLAQISVNAATMSMAGGIAGRFKAATLGVAGIDRCYFAGKISAVSDSKGSVDAGGIVGFLFDDEAYIETQSGNAALFAAAEKGTVRNCFAAADITASTSSVSCYAGYIYARKNADASMSNCAAYDGMKVVGTKIEKANTSEKSIEAFYNSDYLAELGFDFETIWTANETAFPVLHYEATAKNVFRVKTLHYDSNERTLTVSFLISFRDVESYTVLAGAYSGRGKMVDFTMKKVDNAEKMQTVEIELYDMDIEEPETFTISVVDSATLALLDEPIELHA